MKSHIFIQEGGGGGGGAKLENNSVPSNEDVIFNKSLIPPLGKMELLEFFGASTKTAINVVFQEYSRKYSHEESKRQKKSLLRPHLNSTCTLKNTHT